MALESKKYLDYEGLGKVLNNIKNVYLGGIVVDSYITADAYNALDGTERAKYTLVSGGVHDGKYRKVANVKEYVDDKVNKLDLNEVGGTGKVIATLSQEDGKVSATAIDLVSGAVAREVAGGISGTTVETALVELQEKINASNAAQKSYKLVAADNTDENVREAWKIQVAEGNGVYNDVEGSATIKIYKDAQIHRIYLGTPADTINVETGAITEKAGATETDKQSLNYAYIKPDGKYDLVRIDVSKFLKEAEFKNGLEVAENGEVSVKIDTNSEKFLTVGAAGVKLSGVQDAINTKIENLGGAATSDTVAGISTKVTTSKGEVSGVEVIVADNAVTAGGVKNNRTLTAANANAVIKGNALAAIVQHIKDVVSDNTADLAVKAEGDTYVDAKIADDDNKKVVVRAKVNEITVTKTGNADTTMSGTGTTLVSGGEVANKVSKFVNDRIGEEVAKLDATVSSDASNVNIAIVETDGKLTSITVSEDYATVTRTERAENKTESISFANGDDNKLIKSGDLKKVADYAKDLYDHEVADRSKAIADLDADVTSDDAAVAKVQVVEENGKIKDVVVTNVSAGVSAAGDTGARTLSATTNTGAVTGADIATIKTYVDNMVADTNGSFVAITEAEIIGLF